ncbi:MAG: [Fe-Fe] hydrogenase large subunit C-terminal domain-containing protein [Lachnospiraceae bacterium]
MKLVYTNEKCIGCNKCIRACKCVGASVATIEDGNARINVDPAKCIGCGACIDACEHNARSYEDDTERFFQDLASGKKISILLAPAFKANYPEEYESVLGGLKALGVNRIISVSFGADITTWGYLNYVAQNNFLGGISQPCPAVVGYIERYVPELLPKLFPVQSPMMCAAIYMKKYAHLDDALAFISPCIAKKLEIDDPKNGGYISYNVTFDHLMDYVKRNHITGTMASDEIEYGLGSIYPMPGGLKENVYWFLGEDVYIRQVEGQNHIYDYLHHYSASSSLSKGKMLFVDALNCSHGCLEGTGVERSRKDETDVFLNVNEIKNASKSDKKKSAWFRKATPAKRLEALNKQFKDLKLQDFLREYTDRSESCRVRIPDDAALEQIYQSMYKDTYESRHIDCQCCGYSDCHEMAVAIYNGFNRKENCIHYVKDEILHQRADAETVKQAINTIYAQFEDLYMSVDNMTRGNEENARESTELSSDMQDISAFNEQLNNALQEIARMIEKLEDNNKAIMSVATKTNLISLNARIEASHAGSVGRGFAVVAEEIQELAVVAKQTAENSTDGQKKVLASIQEIIQSAKKLAETINTVNGRAESLAATTEQIAASSDTIISAADAVKEELKVLH